MDDSEKNQMNHNLSQILVEPFWLCDCFQNMLYEELDEIDDVKVELDVDARFTL